LTVVVDAGRVSPHFGRSLREGFKHLRSRRSGRVVVEITADTFSVSSAAAISPLAVERPS
jgi:hypothetical protein